MTPITDILLLRAASLIRAMSLASWSAFRNAVTGNVFLGFLVAHHGHADAAVRMAAAAELAPIRIRPVHQIREIGERAHEADREPVAHRLAETGLILHVVRQMRQRVALGLHGVHR